MRRRNLKWFYLGVFLLSLGLVFIHPGLPLCGAGVVLIGRNW